MTRDAEALVIGGGPVGLFAALSLFERGASVQVLDATSERAVRGYACGLHPESLRLFDGLGLMPALLEAGHRVERLALRRGAEHVATAELAALSGAYPFVLTLRQSELEELFEEALASRGVAVARRHAVTHIFPRNGCVRIAGHRTSELHPNTPSTQSQHVAVEPIEREADFVIGADGYFSSCRRALAIDLVPVRPARAFAVCEFLADLRGWEREASIVLAPDSVSAFWPLGPNLGRWTFQVYDQLDEMPSLEYLQALLRERAPWFLPKPEQLCWGAVAPFEHRLAPRFGQGRIWLAGDAAHSTSPVGFHSMNRGFSEADGLSRLLASALHDDDYLSTSFERFEREQHAEWDRLFGTSSPPRAGCSGAELAPCLPASGADHDALAAQLGSRTALAS